MQANKLENEQSKEPMTSARCGPFQISIWRIKKIIPAPAYARDYCPDREITIQRALIQHGKWDKTTSKWINTNIWCDSHALRDLAQALEDLDTQLTKAFLDSSPSQQGEEPRR